MPNRKTRERQLAKLAARRAAERRRRQRQRIVAAVVAFAVLIGFGIVAFVVLGGGGTKNAGKGRTPTPATSTTGPVSHCTPGANEVCPQPAPATVACGAKAPPEADRPKPQFAAAPDVTIDPAATYVATMKTSCGTIKIELLPKQAPQTVNSFVFLAGKHFFDGTYFHRIAGSIDVIQGGDPEGSGGGGPGYSIPDELTGQDTYGPGTVAMANAGPNTGGSQFFIIAGPRGHGLDQNPAYTVFGNVVAGLDVARTIESQPVQGTPGTNPRVDGRPDVAIYVDSVTVEVKGGAAPSTTPTPSTSASATPSASASSTPSPTPTKKKKKS
jgi:cyclophilin family peptidyl-prolyl cis-trans isomerase